MKIDKFYYQEFLKNKDTINLKIFFSILFYLNENEDLQISENTYVINQKDFLIDLYQSTKDSLKVQRKYLKIFWNKLNNLQVFDKKFCEINTLNKNTKYGRGCKLQIQIKINDFQSIFKSRNLIDIPINILFIEKGFKNLRYTNYLFELYGIDSQIVEVSYDNLLETFSYNADSSLRTIQGRFTNLKNKNLISKFIYIKEKKLFFIYKITKDFDKKYSYKNGASNLKNTDYQQIFRNLNEEIHFLIGKEQIIEFDKNKNISQESDVQSIIENKLMENSLVKELNPLYYIKSLGIADTFIVCNNGRYVVIEYKFDSDKRVVSQVIGYAAYISELLNIDINLIDMIVIQKKFRKSDFGIKKLIKNLYLYEWSNSEGISLKLASF